MKETIKMAEEELRKNWSSTVVTAPFNKGLCPNRCPDSYLDINFKIHLEVYDYDSKRYVPETELSSLLRD